MGWAINEEVPVWRQVPLGDDMSSVKSKNTLELIVYSQTKLGLICNGSRNYLTLNEPPILSKQKRQEKTSSSQSA